MNKALIAGTLLLFLNIPAWNQQNNSAPLKFSLSQAQDYAVTNSYTTRNSKLDLESARKKVLETTAIGLPQFTIGANYQHLFNIPTFSIPTTGITQSKLTGTTITDLEQKGIITQVPVFGGDASQYYVKTPGIPLGSPNNTTFNFTLSELIFSGEYIVGLQASRTFKQLSEQAYAKTTLTTKEQVADSYFLLLILRENFSILSDNLKNMNSTLSDITRMKEKGFVEQTDVDQIGITVKNLETTLNSLKGQIDVTGKLLKFQMGIDFEQPIELTDSLAGIISQTNTMLFAGAQFNVDNSIDYQLMKTNEGLSALSLKREKSKYLPTFSAFYQHQEQSNPAAFNFMMKDVLGVTMSFPIFTSGSRIAKVSQAKMDLEKNRNNLDLTRQSLIMDFEKSKNDYLTSWANSNTNKQSYELAKRVYEKTLIKYKQGMASSLDLTQSNTQLLTAESNYYTSLLNLLNAKSKLERILSDN